MNYKMIAEELLRKGFSKNEYGSPEKKIGNIRISFVEHPFYYVIMYNNDISDGRTFHTPGEIKLPLKCGLDDVNYVIESLTNGIDENEIVMNVSRNLDTTNNYNKQETNDKSKSNKENIDFEIKETIGVLSISNKRWSKELNIISWSGKVPKFDIREWSPEHDKMSKGITLSNEELRKLKELLNRLEL